MTSGDRVYAGGGGYSQIPDECSTDVAHVFTADSMRLCYIHETDETVRRPGMLLPSGHLCQ